LPNKNSNLYSTHPVYYEHRPAGTHAAFLLNSNGMDVKINQVNGKTVLEYNILGKFQPIFESTLLQQLIMMIFQVVSLTSTSSPDRRATLPRSHASTLRSLVCPLRSRGGRMDCTSEHECATCFTRLSILVRCRYGYTDFVAVADVIENYALAGIPLDTMWTGESKSTAILYICSSTDSLRT